MKTLLLKRADTFWFPKPRCPSAGARPSLGNLGRFTAAATLLSWEIPTMNPVVRSAAVPAEFPGARRVIRVEERAVDVAARALSRPPVLACLFGRYPSRTLTCGYLIHH